MLTESQNKVLNEIEKFIAVNKISPTVREIADLVGFKPTATVHRHLGDLEKKSYISKNPDSPRSIKVIKESNIMVPVQLETLKGLKDQFVSIECEEGQVDVRKSINHVVVALMDIIDQK